MILIWKCLIDLYIDGKNDFRVVFMCHSHCFLLIGFRNGQTFRCKYLKKYLALS